MQQICSIRFYISNFIGNPQLSNFYRDSLMINIACWVDHLSRAMLFINTSPMVCCSIWGILITSVLFRYLLCRGRTWDATDRSHFRPSKLPCGFIYRIYSIWQPYKPFILELKINSQTLILSEVLQCIYYRMTESQNLQKKLKDI